MPNSVKLIIMDQWYIPITILPGICLIILSTSNLLIAINGEIFTLCRDHTPIKIVRSKIRQLERLSKAMVLLYIASALMVLSGILSAFDLIIGALDMGFISMISGVILTLVSLFLLISYASHAVTLRKAQHEITMDEKDS